MVKIIKEVNDGFLQDCHNFVMKIYNNKDSFTDIERKLASRAKESILLLMEELNEDNVEEVI